MPVHRIAFDLHCIKCKYDLRGLDALARCPECGTHVMNSAVATIDPSARKFVLLKNPARDGLSLVIANGSLLIALVAATLPVVIRAVMPGTQPTEPFLDALAASIAGGAILTGFAAALSFHFQDDQLLHRELGRYRPMLVWGMLLVLLAIGLLLTIELRQRPFLGLDMVGAKLVCAAVALSGATLGGFALRRAFAVLGRRSRDFRRAHQSRQSIEVLFISSAALVASATAAAILNKLPPIQYEDLAELATLLALVLLLAVICGLVYTTLNAWWIARSLMQRASDQVFSDD
ncbi:MAG: hypothetical protein EXS00_07670 [Phycisphaerales bacterium]|nr:hypothetical protein [Phycisphaerales bacterium]